MLTRRDVTLGVAVGVFVGSLLATGLVVAAVFLSLYLQERKPEAKALQPEPEPDIREMDMSKRYDIVLQHEDGDIRQVRACKLLGRAAPADLSPRERRFEMWSTCELLDGRMHYFRADDLIALEESDPPVAGESK